MSLAYPDRVLDFLGEKRKKLLQPMKTVESQKKEVSRVLQNFTKEQLEQMTLPEIQTLLEERGIPNTNIRTKKETIQRLLQAQQLYIEYLFS